MDDGLLDCRSTFTDFIRGHCGKVTTRALTLGREAEDETYASKDCETTHRPTSGSTVHSEPPVIMRGIVRRARDRRGDHGLGTLLRNNDRRIAGPTDSSGALLLGIYALLPMIVVLSRYSLSMMVVGAMAIFTVKFWSVRSNASMSSTVVALGNSA